MQKGKEMGECVEIEESRNNSKNVNSVWDLDPSAKE